MLKNKKKNSSSITKKIPKSIKRIGLISLSTLLLVIIINVIISKTTGVNFAKKTYDYIAKAVNGEKTINGKNTEVLESVEIKSSDSDEPGSWKAEKSAEWTGLGKAKVTFNVDTIIKTLNKNKDIILVIDISGSMRGSKLDKAKADAIELVDMVLSNKKNRVALISFDSGSTIVSDFTNNKADIINKINSLTAYDATNYNQALKNVDSIMDGYKKDSDKEVITLFLTDGYPNEETPNQVGTYELLKDKYPYMTINGIQYEMGKDIVKEIKQISDNQWAADQTTLDNVLFEASIDPIVYEKYEIVDYINKEYFTLDKEKDIEVSVGTVRVEEENGYEKVIWTLDPFMTGKDATMNIYLVLKDEYKNKGGSYPTNYKEEINYKFPNEEEKHVESDKTPILKYDYEVIYDTNTPEGCKLAPMDNESHFVNDNVIINQNKLSCEGYNFKGWRITEDDVQKINDDVFVMPNHDVNLVATWSKLSIEKDLKGRVWVEKISLYDTVATEGKRGIQAKLYTGQVDDTFETNANKSVYYYTGNVTKNNVLFGGYCWKIVRTTTTGGVKILYNGKPTSDGQCTAVGSNATVGGTYFNDGLKSPAYVGYMYNKVYKETEDQEQIESLYGESVKYENGRYELTGDIITSNIPNSKHHYSCGNAQETTCEKVRYYFFERNSYGPTYYSYIELNGENDGAEALNKMLYADDVNIKDSTVKTFIDNWYEENFIEYTDYLEDTIFCNDRSIINLSSTGWNPNGGVFASIKFTEYDSTTKLTCKNVTDRFSTKNKKAQLKYPIGLLSSPEANLQGSDRGSTQIWLLSPCSYSTGARVNIVSTSGKVIFHDLYLEALVKPSVSLKPGILYYSGGDGTTTNPFEIVEN